MILGPDQIGASPRCGALAKHTTLVSGNTLGSRVWTDGKRISPMLPRPPVVVKCHQCAECFWLDQAEKVGTVERRVKEGRIVDPAWTAAPVVQEPTEEEYYQALQKGLAADARHERSLRVSAWWRSNDSCREISDSDVDEVGAASGKRRENLQALVGLLREEDENDRIMKAEALRQLGEFKSAHQVLGRVSAAEYAEVVR